MDAIHHYVANPSIVVILAPVSLNSKHRTTLCGFAIHMNSAGAATTGIAANMCARKSQAHPADNAPATIAVPLYRCV